MIKEIKELSGGAQIKVLSDRAREKETDETPLAIMGTLTQKKQAANVIAERIVILERDFKVFRICELFYHRGNLRIKVVLIAKEMTAIFLTSLLLFIALANLLTPLHTMSKTSNTKDAIINRIKISQHLNNFSNLNLRAEV